MKILVVDDHALVREGLCQILQGLDENIEVYEAADCAAAFEVASLHNDLDLVLLQIPMVKLMEWVLGLLLTSGAILLPITM